MEVYRIESSLVWQVCDCESRLDEVGLEQGAYQHILMYTHVGHLFPNHPSTSMFYNTLHLILSTSHVFSLLLHLFLPTIYICDMYNALSPPPSTPLLFLYPSSLHTPHSLWLPLSFSPLLLHTPHLSFPLSISVSVCLCLCVSGFHSLSSSSFLPILYTSSCSTPFLLHLFFCILSLSLSPSFAICLSLSLSLTP